MFNQNGHCQGAAESDSAVKSELHEEDNLGQEKVAAEPAESDSCLEQSFEIVPHPTREQSLKMDSDRNGEGQNDVVNLEEQQAEAAKTAESSRRNSFQQRIKKSGSFLSRLNSSSQEANTESSTNLPSSLVSAFSSFSSFTSNFTLNSSTNGTVNNSSGSNNNASSLTIETASTSTKLSQITESRDEIFNRKAALERKNLISLTKLIVKDLISSSLMVSRTIDDCHNEVHLNNYFTLIERVLKHGLKQNLLSHKSASLWGALDSLPKYMKESTLISESIRSLTNTKTHDGKIKAWMRLAMMQKKLPDYFNELLANKSVLLKDIYHDYAFMLNDEAHVFAGLIIGVNVIDCNFFVKDANFDMMDDIIDLSPYLKIANSYDDDVDHTDEHQSDSAVSAAMAKMKAVLDQKNYLEERNKRLESTIQDMQVKIKSVEEQNSRLEMEAKLSEARLAKLQAGRIEVLEKQSSNSAGSFADAIKNLIGSSVESTNSKATEESTNELSNDKLPVSSREPSTHMHDDDRALSVGTSTEIEQGSEMRESFDKLSIDRKSATITETGREEDLQNADAKLELANLRKQLEVRDKELMMLKERTSILEASYRSALEKIKCLERDLDIQTSMNADRETTIKIHEKDIREKQAQVESLRNSLNDSKKLNSDLSERLNDTSSKLKERVKMVSTLQVNLDKWKLENKTLANRFQEKQAQLKSANQELEQAKQTIQELKSYNSKINDDLMKERESGQSSSVTVETQNARISELTTKIFRLELELNDVKPFKDQTEELMKKCHDYELSLEEIGDQLRESRLEVENLRENSAVFLDSQWMNSKLVKTCALCQQSFSVTRRKHHCRLCGNVFCQTCSDNKMELASSAKPVRVCDTCHAFLLAKFVKSSTQ